MGEVLEIVPTNAEFLEKFYGMRPPMRLKSITVLKDGEPIAVAGTYFEKEQSGYGHYILFMDLLEGIELQGNKRTLVKAYRILMNQLRDKKFPVYSLADPQIEGSTTLLEHLGFEHMNGDIYQWQA